MALEVGSVVEGVVTGVTNFGAFVQLPTGETGLVHISEVSDEYVENIEDFVKKEDHVRVKVLSVDPVAKRIGLSIRQAQEGWKPKPKGGRSRGNRRGPQSFEEKLARFMKESEERQRDARRRAEGKRGGRGH
ncbi:MAG: S1 RNA-binding domain-containing protein [Bacillota bacterium]|nr:S1 RNA-binding domain-containing protein [Bacillota bacterium]